MKKFCKSLPVQRRKHIALAVLSAVLVFSACAMPAKSGSGKTGSYLEAAAGGEEQAQAVESLYTQEQEEETAQGGEAQDGETAGGEAEESEKLSAENGNGGFYYDMLSEEEQAWYADMYAIMNGMYTGAALSPQGYGNAAEQRIDKIFQYVMNDHPELFFVQGYGYTAYEQNGEIVKISFEGDYTMSAAGREQKQEAMDAAVEACLAGISGDATEYEKVKYVYEYIVLHTDYNREAPENQNICSVFIGGESVCQGYAKAAQYLLDRLGVRSTLIVGNVRGGERHAWNLVWVDGSSYYLDVTWGDASYRPLDGEESGLQVSPVNYDYLCITTQELLKTHMPDNLLSLPECTATAANYYVMEGALFDGYEEEAVAAFFDRAHAENRTSIALKCTGEEVYAVFLEKLVEQQEIFRYLDTAGGPVTYVQSPDKLSLTFWLVNE